MSIVEKLMNNAEQDLDLLNKNDALGDNFAVPRVVDFVLYAPTAEKADLVASFINDYAFGDAEATTHEGSHRILVQIEMPTTQHVLFAVSGFMQCLAQIYELEYDGWGSELRTS